jgi:hypothetical protein
MRLYSHCNTQMTAALANAMRAGHSRTMLLPVMFQSHGYRATNATPGALEALLPQRSYLEQLK